MANFNKRENISKKEFFDGIKNFFVKQNEIENVYVCGNEHIRKCAHEKIFLELFLNFFIS